MDMMRRSSTRIWIAVGLAGIVGLAFLAWLQYRWIAQLSEAERDRLRTRAAADVRKVAEEFDTALNRTVRAVIQGPADVEGLANRYVEWRASSSDGGLVRGLFLLDADRLLALDPTTSRFRPQPWPDQLRGIRMLLEDALATRPPRPLVLDAALPAIGIARPRPGQGMPMGPGPGMGFGLRPGLGPPWMRQDRPGGPAWIILELDRDVLTRTVLAGLIAQHLRDDAYAARVLTNDDRRATLLSLHADGVSFAEPDVATRLFDVRMGPMAGAAPAMMNPPAQPAGAWTLQLKHRAGSFELAVARTRTINLAVSFATLLVMAGALAAVLVSTRRAQSLAHSQMEFVAGVSHELRTPLSVICSAAENLADGIVTNEQGVRRYGTVIRSEGRRLAGMVEQILRFAGIQSGRARYELQPTPVGSLVDGAIAACQAEIEKAGVAIERNLDPAVPDIQADRTAMTHALRNLIDNAVVHGGSGKYLGVAASERNGAVEISVEDRGPGIPSDERGRIFEPFARGRRATGDQIHGFGLGLALVKRIVDAHSGSITVDTTPLRTRFTIRIPAASP